jgi:peptide/nickel transport system permease protein
MREISLPLPWSTVEKVSGRLQAMSRSLWRLIKEKPLGAFGGVIVLGLLLCALLAPWIATHPYDQTNVRNRLKPPGSQFYFGTDNLGRDIFSRIVYGARVSVTVGFGAVSIGISLATIIGVGCAYFGGKSDILVQRLVDAQVAIPGLLLLLNIMAVMGPGLLNIILALGVVSAAGSSRIILCYVLPNIIAPIIIIATVSLGFTILIESTLSFLGFGVPPPYPSWGEMLSGSGRSYMHKAPWMATWPGIAISLAVFGFNMLGDALRDLLDPRLRGGRLVQR